MAFVQALMPAVLGNVSFINSLLTSVGVLLALVPQLLQNGNSQLGILPSPVLPSFLGGPGHGNYPWGNRTVNNTNPYVSLLFVSVYTFCSDFMQKDAPDTGIVRYYDLYIARGVLAPDGYQKDVILVNGQFPGPLLEANWGDYFHITVHNNITGPVEGTSLHWHG